MSGGSASGTHAGSGGSPGPGRTPLIGVVGGIGAGKSEAARALGRLGCLVSDSDAEARRALERPEVAARVAAALGSGVVDASGVISRPALAAIVFSDPDKRRRLEEIIHPLVHAARRRTVAEAAEAGSRAVIVDAPLLFEAGVDKECDAVIFVESPQEARLARVLRTRGWSGEELARREASQLSLDEKRRRSRYILNNDGTSAGLEREAARVLERILTELAPQHIAGARAEETGRAPGTDR